MNTSALDSKEMAWMPHVPCSRSSVHVFDIIICFFQWCYPCHVSRICPCSSATSFVRPSLDRILNASPVFSLSENCKITQHKVIELCASSFYLHSIGAHIVIAYANGLDCEQANTLRTHIHTFSQSIHINSSRLSLHIRRNYDEFAYVIFCTLCVLNVSGKHMYAVEYNCRRKCQLWFRLLSNATNEYTERIYSDTNITQSTPLNFNTVGFSARTISLHIINFVYTSLLKAAMEILMSHSPLDTVCGGVCVSDHRFIALSIPTD